MLHTLTVNKPNQDSLYVH